MRRLLLSLTILSLWNLGACADRRQSADMSAYTQTVPPGDSFNFRQVGNVGTPDRRCEIVDGREKCYGIAK